MSDFVAAYMHGVGVAIACAVTAIVVAAPLCLAGWALWRLSALALAWRRRWRERRSIGSLPTRRDQAVSMGPGATDRFDPVGLHLPPGWNPCRCIEKPCRDDCTASLPKPGGDAQLYRRVHEVFARWQREWAEERAELEQERDEAREAARARLRPRLVDDLRSALATAVAERDQACVERDELAAELKRLRDTVPRPGAAVQAWAERASKAVGVTSGLLAALHPGCADCGARERVTEGPGQLLVELAHEGDCPSLGKPTC